MQASGDKPALLQTASTTPGLVGPALGGCCSRAVDMEYKLTSPYLNVGYEVGALNVDASVRQDRQRANGTANIATLSGGSQRYEAATMQMVDYKLNHNSYSVGGNYAFWQRSPASAMAWPSMPTASCSALRSMAARRSTSTPSSRSKAA
jgi:hypothetical protein